MPLPPIEDRDAGEAGGPARAASVPPHLDALTEYLWGSLEPPTLLFRTPGFAHSGLPTDRRGAEPLERVEPARPPGIIHLYPRFMVFLSLAEPVRGGRGDGLVDAARLLSIPTIPPLGSVAYRRLRAHDRARLLRPLEAPGTLSVPLGEVRTARAARWLGSACIELAWASSVVRLGAHPALSKATTAPLVAASTRWEPRLLTLLQELIDGGPGPREH